MMIALIHVIRRMVRHPSSVVRVGVLLFAVLAYGATGFMFFESDARTDLTWSDAAWWTVVTITTVGYGDIAPASGEARFVVGLPLMVFGIALLGYVLSLAAAALVEAKTRELTGMGHVRLDKHLIIVNMPSLGKVERLLAEILHPAALGPDVDIVLVDEDLPQLPPELVDRNVHFVRGAPARDETLSRARLERASCAIVLAKRPGDTRSDNENIAIALAIEARSPHVRTVVECVDASTEELLRKARCNSIVCTSRFDAHFVGAELANPGSQEVIEHLLSSAAGGQQLFVTDLQRSRQTFGALASTCLARGHIAIGAKQKGQLQLNPPADALLGEGDALVTIGPSPLAL